MKSHEIGISLLDEQRKQLVDLTWSLPEGSQLCESLTGVLNLLDLIHDEIEKRGTVQFEKATL